MKKATMAGIVSWMFIMLVFVLLLCYCSIMTKRYSVKSPDKRITVRLLVGRDEGVFYKIDYCGKSILDRSRLGLIRADGDFAGDLTLESVSPIELVKSEYQMLQGKKSQYSYTANKKVFHFSNNSGQKIDIIFQVSNDGAAFRYVFPEKSEEIKKITQELSSFNFFAGTQAWIQPKAEAATGWCSTQPSYEEFYEQQVDAAAISKNKAGWVFPALFCLDGYWMLISETAPDRDYCGSMLEKRSAGGEFFIGFADKKEVFSGGEAQPQSCLSWLSPWRIITIGHGLNAIVDSTLGTDLAEPEKPIDFSFVKPGRASWSWVLLKDESVVYDVQKQFVDFAAQMNWEYCLVDASWDTQIGYKKIIALAEYAKSKNVGLILWYNSSGSWNTTTLTPKSKLLTHEARIKEFSKLKEIGIKGIKVDFFAGDGQSMMNYYQDIFEDAAKFSLTVNCHGSTIPRGWHRTYPNLLTMEAVKGFEYVTFEQGNANRQPNHCCMLPFTRNVFDPMDFTPVCFSEVPGIKRITTNGFELALAVVFWSGIQHYAETPEGMAAVPNYVKDALREIPSYWQDSRFIYGYPGKLAVIARKSQDAWFIAGINGENFEKELKLDLSFIPKNTEGILITDGSDNRSFVKKQFKPGQPLKIKSYGGFLIRFSD